MNAKQITEDKIYSQMHSSFKQFSLPVLVFLCTALN